MDTSKFAIPEIIFGHGAIKHVAQCALRLGARRVLVVSDHGLERAGWVEKLFDILAYDGLEWVYFNDVSQNPRDYQVHNGAEIYLEEKADVVIALGGGSPLDMAKGIATIAGNGGRIDDYEGANRIMRPLPPMIFVPSTAGSGSDISQFCIITDMQRQVKMSIISRSLVPNISIIDPDLLLTKPPELVVSSAIDALSHAIESYVSKLASPFTENQALNAIKIIITHLEPAVETRSVHHLEQLSIASTWAGMSFSNASLGAVHALAHSLGGVSDIPHGLVHPILLPAVMRYNMPECLEKMATIGNIILGPCIRSRQDVATMGIDQLGEFFKSFGVPVHMREIAPDDSKLEHICRMALQDACMLTNPRDADWKDLLGICLEAW
ncbi:alcohol dehydrogenase, class IV [Desulfocurvibacter africanus PCS]|uniref:Alcohol dehydrogenase, class IV n=1 Tax=Desulfocurvibacter africanus PCS TaxID=1262666 RepID=M5PXB9_DESAF|nr:iron-containing alcohol dehydrogenase [Desulfocurvibacter africanus]EMG38957.1 alcohol dehydrogenase, class IV [Desulfocurvibacter africanus PCS]